MKRLSLLVMMLVASTAFAQDDKGKKPPATDGAAAAPASPPAAAGPMTMPKPGPELDALKPMVRSWSCKGTGVLPGPTPVNISYSSKVTAKWDLNNFWADWKYDRGKTKEVPAFVGEGEWGYDVASKKYVMQGMDSWGGWINLTSAGPSGDSFVFEGDLLMMGQKVPGKMTFTTDAKAKKLHFTIEAGGAKILDDDCK